MKFHPTVRDRSIPLLILAICVGLVIASACFFSTRTGVVRRKFGEALGVTSFLLAGAVYVNWLAWSTAVQLGDREVAWKDGNATSSLAWENISGLGWKEERKYLKVGLVEKATGQLRLLPFFSRPLYAALRERCGRLPAEIEKMLGFRD